MNGSEVINKPKSKEKTQEPSLYAVVLHNDPFTPRAFVVLTLKTCFRLLEPEADRLMRTAHESGHAVVTVTTRELAETKASRANAFSTQHGRVLLFTAEKHEE